MEDLHATLSSIECTDTLHDMDAIAELIKATELKTYSVDHTNLPITLIRCADLSHFTFKWPEHTQRCRRLCAETKMVFDAKSQVDFMTKFVVPQFVLLDRLMQTPLSAHWLDQVNKNLTKWNVTACNFPG